MEKIKQWFFKFKIFLKENKKAIILLFVFLLLLIITLIASKKELASNNLEPHASVAMAPNAEGVLLANDIRSDERRLPIVNFDANTGTYYFTSFIIKINKDNVISFYVNFFAGDYSDVKEIDFSLFTDNPSSATSHDSVGVYCIFNDDTQVPIIQIINESNEDLPFPISQERAHSYVISRYAGTICLAEDCIPFVWLYDLSQFNNLIFENPYDQGVTFVVDTVFNFPSFAIGVDDRIQQLNDIINDLNKKLDDQSTIFFGIADLPIEIVKNLFNVEIMGVNLLKILIPLLFIGLVWAIIKIFKR